MSQTETQPTETEITKTVTIVGYAPEEYGSFREWADDNDEHRDYHKTKQTETTERSLECGDWSTDLKKDEFEELLSHDLGDFELVKETNEVTEHDTSKRRFSGKVRDEVVEQLPEEVAGAERYMGLGSPHWELGDDKVVVVSKRTDTMPLLKHQSDLEPDDMYEDEDVEIPCVKIKVKVKNAGPELKETLDEEIVEPAVKLTGRHPAVSRVRVAECEQETKEKGACLRI